MAAYFVGCHTRNGPPKHAENVGLGSTATGTPIRVADVATVQEAPDVRRGLADLDGRGDVVGGIVVMRFGENALATIDRVKEKLAELEAGLPEGVVVRPVYDRSELIERSSNCPHGRPTRVKLDQRALERLFHRA